MAAPKLRFKEFDGDWSQSKIGEIFQVTSGSTPLRSDNRFFENADIAWVKTTDLNNGLIEKTEEKISQIALKETSVKILPKGTVFVAMYGGFNQIGRTGLLVHEAACNQALSAIYPNEKIDSYFLLTFLNHKVDDWKNFAASSRKDPNITKSDVLAFPLKYPVKEEQTKIASFLSVVDEKISQLTQKHALLSQYKQGMMQKLFSQQIRFKADDGSEFGEWEEKTLIDSVDTNIKWSFTGGPFGSNLKSEDYTELGIRIIQLQNIGDGAFLNDYKIYTSPEKANELLSCNIYPDEILISKMGDPVARCCIVPKHHDRYVMCSDGIRLVVDKQNYSSIFMFYQINYQDFRQSASDVSTGSTRKRIGLSDLKQLPIKVPCLEEQTKIANFLSAIDQKIEVVAQQIEQAKTWKKGLLQQMFV